MSELDELALDAWTSGPRAAELWKRARKHGEMLRSAATVEWVRKKGYETETTLDRNALEWAALGLALHGDQAAFEAAQLEMDEEDQRAASARLAELEVSDEEYFAPSMSLEAIDIVVDTIRSRRMAEGDPIEMALTPEDYES